MNERQQRAFALLNARTTGVATPLADMLDPAFEEVERPQVTAQGVAGLQAKLAHFHRVHRDVTIVLHRQISEGDVVCTQWVLSATVKAGADGEGTPEKTVVLPGMSWTHFSPEDKIIKNRVYSDIVGQMLQRGYQWAPAGTPNPSTEEAQA
jgi:SnoaL-like polyketide cyclase